MMATGQNTAPEANEIVSARDIAAPRDRVWRAFADPTQLALWWGPRGFTNTFHEFDIRAGGRWRFTMFGPDGARYEQTREFLEVVPRERIVLANDDPVHRFVMTIVLESRSAGTRLTWSMAFDDVAEFDRVKHLIAAANEENFNRLESHLAGMA